jgi:hypothetical protein
MLQETKQKSFYFNVYLQTTAVAPRCRKPAFHMVDIARRVSIDLSEEQKAQIIATAQDKLKSFKNVQGAVVKFTFTERELGSPFESVELFSSKHITVRLV